MDTNHENRLRQPESQTEPKKHTLSEDTDYENPAGRPGFSGDGPQRAKPGEYLGDPGYGEFLNIGNEL
jgi:hypothetical protein